MRVIVCGGRHYSDHARVARAISALNPSTVVVVTGGATGADQLANEIAQDLGFETEVVPADWSFYGRRAGPIRNKQMLEKGAALVIAFPGGRGTAHMVRIAREAGVPVLEVPDA